MLARASMISISDQMEKMTKKFAVKCAENPKFSQWFQLNETNINTRSIKPKYKPVPARTSRYAASPLPQLTALLNARDMLHQQKK